MARLPAPGPLCAPPRPLRPPERLAPAGSQLLYPPPGRSTEPLAAPPAGLQMAPCGCFFDPRIYHIEWAATGFLPPPAYKLSGAAPPGALVLEAQPFVPAEPGGPYARLPSGGSAPCAAPEEAEAARPAVLLALPPLALPEPPLRRVSHIEGRLKPLAAPPGAAPAELPEQVLLEDAMRLLDCSLGGEAAGGGAQLGPAGRREEPARDFRSLWLPEELLSSDYSVPEVLGALLSMEHFYAVRLGPEEPGWDAGPEPPLGAHDRWLETEGERPVLGAAGAPGALG